jgi:predicted ATPase with chaperone activity
MSNSGKMNPSEFLRELRRRTAGDQAVEPLDASADGHAPDPEGEPEYVNSGRGGVVRRRRAATPDVIRGHAQLAELFDRVNTLLGDEPTDDGETFRPRIPESLRQAGLTSEEIEKLVMKFLLQRGSATGREICSQVRLPFSILDPLLKEWKNERMVAFKGAAEMGDYIFTITDFGRERARRYNEECTYFGAAPVSLRDYLEAMEAQSIARQEADEADLRRAFSDLLISEKMLEKLGPAINSGRGMFLFGEAGNGKTSIAERITACFGSTVWIPRALGIDGDIIRLFDPGVHVEVAEDAGEGLFDLSGVDTRWVRIVRPTIVAGGELTMSELEVTQNTQTKICEAPLQLKSNCGTLVIDDFGRQTMPVDTLLNRWIVPLEKRFDFLNLPSGKKIQVPFDQLIIFSTNLEPKDIVDGAFLRRIPYKIQVPDPSEEHFRKLFEIMSPKMGLVCEQSAVDYLVEKHYKAVGRPFRNCQPRDLLLQVRNYATYKRQPKRMTPEAFDFAVENYFSVM